MSGLPNDDDLALAHRLADAARAASLPYFRADTAIDNKLGAEGQGGGFDPVTEADRAAERAMRELLEAERPKDGIIGEEFGVRTGVSGRDWVLDPIDGTRAFIAGLPTWTVLIALNVLGRPRLGLIDQPHTGERFVGGAAGGLYQRGSERRALKSRQGATLSTAILATTDPDLFSGAEAGVWRDLSARARLTRYGYDAYAYAMIAMGGVDLVVESGLQKHDVCALAPVVEAAGGVLTDWRGGPAWEAGQIVAAAHPGLLEEVLAVLAPAAL